MAAQPSVRDGSDIGQATRPSDDREHGGSPGARDCAAGRHRLFVVGYLRGPRPVWLDCDRPLRVLCRDCDHETRWACSGHRESRCKPCSARYRRRVQRVARSGTDRASGYQYLLTLTAPGERAHRLPSGDWCSCTPHGGVDLARWNASHSGRWNRLRTALRRDHPALQYFRGIEVQVRGALHDHAMVWSPTPLSRGRVKQLAMEAGFGHSLDLAPAPPGSKRAAYYVSKYVTKATDSRADVPWWGTSVDVDLDTGEVLETEGLVDGRYRTWSMSREWGLTMAAARAHAREIARAHAAEQDAAVLATVSLAFPGTTLVPPPETPPLSSA